MSSTWLFLTKAPNPLMKGAAVKRWQEQLLALKYDLAPWGADGQFGLVTDRETRKFQTSAGLQPDGIVGERTLYAANTKINGGVVPPPPTDPHLTIIEGVEVWDYRGEIARPSNTGSQGLRPWSQITGIMLHRTACVLGETPSRYFPVNAHIGVTMGGRIILPHFWALMIWHGHSPSSWTIGIEFDGNPEGKPGYFWKPGGGPHEITDAQVKAAGVLLNLLKDAFTNGGSKIQYIVAHRQSSKDRECDPGHQAWKKIAIPWMKETGAIPGPREDHPPTAGLVVPVGYAGDTWSDGAQISYEWDVRSSVPFWI